jgi:hypothetical protein
MVDLEQAMARIADLEVQVAALAGERDAMTGRVGELEAVRSALDARLAETTGQHESAATGLAEAQSRGLGYLRRAVLAEHAGRIVPELVGGADEEALLASVDVARQAYGRAVEAARAAIVSQSVPAGAPSARTASVAGLTPLQMIESGLSR